MTIKEIAKLAQVSSAAVSRYLNGGYVSEEKKERIRAVIEETGYRPSAQARNLRMKKAGLIGVLAPKMSLESVAQVLDGIGEVLNEKQFHMLLTVTNGEMEKELEAMNFLENYPVDGMILLGTTRSKKQERFFEKCRTPVVVVGQYTEKANCIYHDVYGAAKELAKQIGKGQNRTMACLCVEREDPAFCKEREDGFLEGLKEAGVELLPSRCRRAECSVEAAYEKTKELLESENGIEMLFCAADTLAAGALQAVREREQDGEGKILVTGFGDQPFWKAVSNQSPTVHFYYNTSGRKAAEMLVDVIENGDPVPMQMKLGYQIQLSGQKRSDC